MLQQGRITRALAATLASRFVYPRSPLFGRVGIHPLRILLLASRHTNRTPLVDDELSRALDSLVGLATRSPPRVVRGTGPRKPLLLFTDGAAEGKHNERVTVGAVLLNPEELP